MNARRDARRRNMAHRERFRIPDFATGLMVVTLCFAVTFIAILLSRWATGTL